MGVHATVALLQSRAVRRRRSIRRGRKVDTKRKKADVDLTADSDNSEGRRIIRAVEQKKPEWASEMSRAIAALRRTLAEMKLAERGG